MAPRGQWLDPFLFFWGGGVRWGWGRSSNEVNKNHNYIGRITDNFFSCTATIGHLERTVQRCSLKTADKDTLLPSSFLLLLLQVKNDAVSGKRLCSGYLIVLKRIFFFARPYAGDIR